MYFIELLLTKECNYNCSYCTTNKPSTGQIEVDLKYLKYVLDCLPDETGVELSGGEIGLINNIDDVFKIVYDHPKIKHIIALSNGLVRVKGIDWINKIEYWEHLIYKIVDKEIIKFYPLEIKEEYKNIVITTESTTNSLIKNWDYFEGLEMFKPHFFYKLMNHKSDNSINNYIDNLFKLFTRLGNKYFISMLLTTKLKNYLNYERDTCIRFSPNPFVDFTTKELGHCAININQSSKWDFNKENLNKLINGEFYQPFEYCRTCHSFDYGLNRNELNNRSYNR